MMEPHVRLLLFLPVLQSGHVSDALEQLLALEKKTRLVRPLLRMFM